MKVLISDTLSDIGIKIFQETPGIEVDVITGLSPEGLKEIIGKYDGLAIRSATKVTASIIEAADNLKVIGRAGIGLDNVDIPAATQRGIVVMNTPDGNTITTAEHTIAMILSLTRNIPHATATLKEGKWEKNSLEGREVFNKTLGIIGAGNIGRIVADRAMGLKMKVIVYDPYIKPDVLKQLGLVPVTLDELLEKSDYLTVHTPKTDETNNLINKNTISRMKKGAMVINCARGGIINEDDVYEALKSGHLGGAAFDVFKKEPPGRINLLELPNFVCTPHLGASTVEAQDNVAKDVAEQISAYLLHGTIKNAVNVPSISGDLVSILRPFASLTEKMGSLQAQLAESGILEAHIDYSGAISQYNVAPLTISMLKGLLTPILGDDVNFVNAPVIAAERGIKVIESRSSTSEIFSSLIELTIKTVNCSTIISGTIFGKDLPRILRINNFYLEAVPEGHNLLIKNQDRPGVIGIIATTLGKNNLNIKRMQVGEEIDKTENIIFLSTNDIIRDEIIEELGNIGQISFIKRIEL